jgi:hypothetical protein
MEKRYAKKRGPVLPPRPPKQKESEDTTVLRKPTIQEIHEMLEKTVITTEPIPESESEQPQKKLSAKCPTCEGTAKCPTCGGTGIIYGG